MEDIMRYLPIWVLWRIWKGRNELIFNRKVQNATEIYNLALADTKEWLDNVKQEVSTTTRPQQMTRRCDKWRKPVHGWVKCNYDVSHHEGNRPSGLGWLVRDSHGTVLECGSGKFQGRLTIEEAECTALIWAIQAVWALGYRHVDFEGDNLRLYNSITATLLSGNIDNLRLQHYLSVLNQWRLMFTEFKISFTHREQNLGADLLAKQAISCNVPWQLYHSCPGFLKHVVNNDIDSYN